MTEIVLTMSVLPPTMNELVAHARGNKFAAAAEKKYWTNAIAIACHKAKVPSMRGRVWLEYIWRVKNFRRDSDNVSTVQKYFLDGLVAAKVIEDDNLGVIKSPVIHHFEKGKDHDGFSVFIRDEASWQKRHRQLPFDVPPTISTQTILEMGNAPYKRKTPARAHARPRASSFRQ